LARFERIIVISGDVILVDTTARRRASSRARSPSRN
jgi:hypothetical protein